jgi:hypothetical protein
MLLARASVAWALRDVNVRGAPNRGAVCAVRHPDFNSEENQNQLLQLQEFSKQGARSRVAFPPHIAIAHPLDCGPMRDFSYAILSFV